MRVRGIGAVPAGLAVRKGMAFAFTGYLRADSPGVELRASLKALLPDGSWTILGTAGLPRPAAE